jgi:hypothetical protein
MFEGAHMFLIIQTTNSTFKSSDGGCDYKNLEQAKAMAVEGCLQIAGDEIRAGQPVSSVEVILKDLDGRQHHRMAIAVSVASLFIPENKGGMTHGLDREPSAS